jgi:hypothetical protein
MRLPALALFLFATAAHASDIGGEPEARTFEHAMRAGDVVEECVRLEAGRSRTFEWRSDAPLDFNIHFHAGEKIAYPVKLAAQSKGGGRFTAKAGEDYCWMWTARQPARLAGKLGEER